MKSSHRDKALTFKDRSKFKRKYQFCSSFKRSEMTKDAGLPEISRKFQICPVNPSSLSDNLFDDLKKKKQCIIVC